MNKSRFVPEYLPPAKPDPQDLCAAFSGDQLVVNGDPEKSTTLSLPSFEQLASIKWKTPCQYLGRLDGRSLYTMSPAGASVGTDVVGEASLRAAGLFTGSLRVLYPRLNRELTFIAGRAYHILRWDIHSRYCGTCGTEMFHGKRERGKQCPQCGNKNYPHVVPAVITAITKGEKILLARNARRGLPHYSLIAGFVEPGETLEECVHRETMEEVGLQIKNLRYFASQPWPFPDSLMVGYFAEHAGGKIDPEPEEIADAAWYATDKLPPLPGPLSLARRMIDHHVNEVKRRADPDSTKEPS
ncbi:MAG: NAD(+) diphosphatase [Spirochaeta sp.]|nr:NAD(+) diphosphatase [Spirochaeta sp.]